MIILHFDLSLQTKKSATVQASGKIAPSANKTICGSELFRGWAPVANLGNSTRVACMPTKHVSITAPWFLSNTVNHQPRSQGLSSSLSMGRDEKRPPGGVLQKSFYREAPPRGSTPYPFIYHFVHENGTPFVYLLLKNGSSLAYLVQNAANLLTAGNERSFKQVSITKIERFLDAIKVRSVHTFLVEVQTNAGDIHATHP